MLLTMTGRIDSYLQFITVLILFVFVLLITYWTTRWIANYQKGKAGAGNLEVIETCRISPNKYVQILRAGEKYLVIAVGKDEVHMLAELSEDELVIRENDEVQSLSFAGVFEQVKKLKEKEKD